MTEPVQLKADTNVCGRRVSPVGLVSDSIVSALRGLLSVLPGSGHTTSYLLWTDSSVYLFLDGLLSSGGVFGLLAHSVRMAFGGGTNVRDVEKTVLSQPDIHKGCPTTWENLREFSLVDNFLAVPLYICPRNTIPRVRPPPARRHASLCSQRR